MPPGLSHTAHLREVQDQDLRTAAGHGVAAGVEVDGVDEVATAVATTMEVTASAAFSKRAFARTRGATLSNACELCA